jgi:hypothetical protein
MGRLIGVAVLVAITLVASACSGGHHLSAHLQKQIAAMTRKETASLGDSSVKTAQVYGPAPAIALDEATSGHRISASAQEPKGRFYLIVLPGHFVCHTCSHLNRGPPPHGTIATQVWSPTVPAYGDFGLRHSLPASMSRLEKPTVIDLD